MRRLLSFYLLAAAAAWGQSNWTDLFPDGNFTGWTRLAIPPTAALGGPQWKVDGANRVVICEGNGGHDWMRYDRELADFDFHVEWRFTPRESGEQKYNSGIFVRNSADGVLWHQGQTGGGSGGYLFGNTLVNGAPQRIALRQQSRAGLEKPAGEWNVYDLHCQGKTIRLTVNGQAASEFNQCEIPKGYIGLEGEGYRIEFRNLRLRELR
ncbi:MAG: DUF1080 domain-containing protein [Bryobacterales bacterium]|nr:DUF1080 domain-containing protein [Bryobacterales bacterium]